MEGDAAWRDTSWRPNLFVPGFSKCGTTALCDYLRQHPDIYMMDPKEPKTLSVDVKNPGWFGKRRRFPRPYAHVVSPAVYRRKFERAKGYRYRAEGTQGYSLPPQFPGRLKRFAPDAKLIFMIREQKARVRSMYAFSLRLHLEPNFERWVEGSFRPHLEFAFFEKMLRSYHDCYGDSMRVVDNQDLLQDPVRMLSEIFAFLGLKDIKVAPLRSNVSEMKMLDEYQRRRALPMLRARSRLITPMGDLLNMMDQEGTIRAHVPLRKLNPFRGLARRATSAKGSADEGGAAGPKTHETIPKDLADILDEDYAASREFCRSANIMLA